MKYRLVDVACCLILLALGLTVALPRFQHGIDLADEGFLAYGAVRVMDGQVPNLDFVSLQPPLSFYSVAAAFRLFGTSLLTMRMLGLGFHLLIPILLFGIARQVSRPLFALAAVAPATVIGLPLFNFVPFAVWHGIVAASAAALAFLRAMVTTRRAWALLAGVATALTLLSRHDQGVYMVLAISSYTLLNLLIDGKGSARRATTRLWQYWVLGAALPLLPLAGHWLHAGALPPMFAQLIVFPLSTYGKTSALPMPQPGLDLSVAANVQAMLFYVPPLLAGLTGVFLLGRALRHGLGRSDAPVAFLGLWSLLFYCQVLVRSDMWHLCITLAPFFALCAWWSERAERVVSTALARRSAGGRRHLTMHAMATVVALLPAVVLWGEVFYYTHDELLYAPTGPERRLALDRAGGVYVNAKTAEGIEKVTGLIQTHVPVDRSILCLPHQPMLYFLSERRNPTRWNYLWPGDQSARDQADFVAQAKRDGPAMALVVKRADVKAYAQAIMDYVDDEYRIVEQIGTLTVYLPRDP